MFLYFKTYLEPLELKCLKIQFAEVKSPALSDSKGELLTSVTTRDFPGKV